MGPVLSGWVIALAEQEQHAWARVGRWAVKDDCLVLDYPEERDAGNQAFGYQDLGCLEGRDGDDRERGGLVHDLLVERGAESRDDDYQAHGCPEEKDAGNQAFGFQALYWNPCSEGFCYEVELGGGHAVAS